MLHITNGDCVVGPLEEGGIPGDKLAWRDVLHEGPVPAGLELEALSLVRAEFIAARGWGAGRHSHQRCPGRGGRACLARRAPVA